MVGLLGLLFSGVTYLIDRQSDGRADARQAREDLTRISDELVALQREYLPLHTSDNAAIRGQAVPLQNSEAAILIAQAEQLISDHSSITGPQDFFAVGLALAKYGDYDRSLYYLRESEERAVEVGDDSLFVATEARAGAGQALFLLGRIEQGRATFARAISADGFSDVPEPDVLNHAIFARQAWIVSEVAIGACAEADHQFAELEEDLAEVAHPALFISPLPRSDRPATPTRGYLPLSCCLLFA